MRRRDDSAMIKAYKRGESAKSIARRLRVGARVITRRLRAANVSIRTRPFNLDVGAIVKAYAGGRSVRSIAGQYGCHSDVILRRLREAGVYIRSLQEQVEKRLNLDAARACTLRSIIDGLLLGDGCIPKGSQLELYQAKKRLGWLKNLQKRLRRLGLASRIDKKIRSSHRLSTGHLIKGGVYYLLRTPAYVEIKTERKRWYPKGKKRVPVDVDLTPLSLAYWFCGDGSCGKDGRLVFYTNGFLRREVEQLATELTALGVEARCKRHAGRREWIVVINKREASQAFKGLVSRSVPKCCQYKLRFVRPLLTTKARDAAYRAGGKRRRKLSNKDVKRLRDLRKEGWTHRFLAGQFGVSPSTVRNYLTGKHGSQWR